MSNLENSQTQLGKHTKEYKLYASIVLAFERTGTELYDTTNMISDVLTEFNYLTEADLKIAIRNGGLGKYGVPFKLTTTVVCFWIREYLKERKTKLGI